MRKVFAVAAALPVVAATSPVGKVVELLGNLKAQVQKDVAAETKLMEEYEQTCDDEIRQAGFDIETASSAIERNSAVIEESSGTIQQKDGVIASVTADVTKKSAELAEAKDVRAAENSDFTAAEKELVDTVDMLGRAKRVLKRSLSLVQSGSKTQKQVVQEMGSMVQALGAIVDAAWVDRKDSVVVKSFLEADDELSLKQPQASVSNYDSKSGGIVETLENMEDAASNTLSETRREEMKKKHAFEMIKQSLEDEIANQNKLLDVTKQEKLAAENAKAEAEGELSRQQAIKAARSDFKSTMTQNCATKNAEWDARQKKAAEEIAALTKAKEILSSGVKVTLLSTGVSTKKVASADTDRSELVSALRKLSRTYGSFQLMQIANKAGSDPFGKVRGLINDMLAKLEKQAQEEATQKAFCDEETKKSAAKKARKIAQIDKYQTRLDKAKAAVAQLNEQISESSAAIAAIDKQNAESTEQRNAENAQYKVDKKDQTESIAAVQKAVQVLNEFYSGSSFIQQEPSTGPSFGSEKGDSGSNIIEFLSVAESDFSTLLAETESNEAEAQAAYDTLMQKNKVSKAEYTASIKGMKSEVKQLNVAIQDNSSDLQVENTELSAILEYIEKLKPQCENKAMSYEERKQRRENEIAGLRQALDILSGEEAALSLYQKKAFLSKKRA